MGNRTHQPESCYVEELPVWLQFRTKATGAELDNA